MAAALAVAGIGGIAWQHQTNHHLEERAAGLSQQVEHLPALRAENERLRAANQDSAAKVIRLQAELDHLNEGGEIRLVAEGV